MQKTEQALAGVVIAYNSDSVLGGRDAYDFAVAQTLTGGYTYPTGYLFETLRGLGLVYVVQSENMAGISAKLPGTFFVFAGCDPHNVNDVVEQSLLNVARLQGSAFDINEKWFGRSKELIDLAEAMEHETPAAQATSAALDELYGLGYDYHEKFATHINAVKLSNVQALARERLRDCVVIISTPAPDQVKIKPGSRVYKTFPPVNLTPKGVQHDVGAK